MPVRFTTPSLGENSSPQLKKHQWQVDVAYRHLHASQWFVGTQVQESSSPFGQPLYINLDSFDITANYGVSDRIALALTLPFSRGTHNRFYQDGTRHVVESAGLGDMNLIGTVWLRKPNPHSKGNFAAGLGVKMPTGDNHVSGAVTLANGSLFNIPADQSVQLGDGGWGVIFQAQGYRSLLKRTSGYFNTWYLMSPRDQTNVNSPYPGVLLSVPDVYSTRFGMAYAASAKRGISITFGTRIDGIPVHDLVGGSDGFRRPGYSFYLEPGIIMGVGHGTYSLSVPLRVHQNFKKSLVDLQLGRPGGGDLADSLILAQYSWRF
jgi:hypothetical protein